MNIEHIKKELNKNKILNKIIYFDEIDSTQKYVKENAKNIESGSIIITDMQTAGIGTKGRVWHTKKQDNLTFTFIIKPNVNIKKYETLTVDLAKQIVSVINEELNIVATIKKPNDVLINGKKVAGILTETEIKGEDVKALFVGIGFNINQMEFDDEIKEIATSLLIEKIKDENKKINESEEESKSKSKEKSKHIKKIDKDKIFLRLISKIENIFNDE